MNNQRGQTAIFIALIFQVLFVLFAMTLNVALVVHDKINLQNSVDLAAYYAAERQAEHLNAIAHVNYQIRQAWKLLSFRYRVLGTLGFDRQSSSSVHPAWTGKIDEAPYLAASRPALCVNYKPTWDEVAKDQNLCNQPGLSIPPLPAVPVIAGFIGINATVSALSNQLINAFNAACDVFGAYNWWFGAIILQNYRLEQENRKSLIYALAQNLSASPDDFIDLNGDSAMQGAQHTFKKNLTFANSNAIQSFEMLNSLGGVDPKTTWLPEIKITPTIVYTDVKAGAGCTALPRLISDLPSRPEAQSKLMDPRTLNGAPLIPWMKGEPPATDSFSNSIGVEKNPWFMAYVGVKATTTPRQIFFPIGPYVTLKAKAYAQPFGGRIGPWFGSQWPRQSTFSVGNPTDNNLPDRTKSDGTLDDPKNTRRLPNYARFPGDTNGLTTYLSQGAFKDLAKVRIKYAWFMKIFTQFSAQSPNDSLAWNYQTDEMPDYRRYELAAIAPDLFDMTYYSIEPNFSSNYLPYIKANRAKFKIPSSQVIRGDLGTHEPKIPVFNIQTQMLENQGSEIQIPQAFYFARKREHLLTAWAPGDGAVDYPAQIANFGKCGVTDDAFKDKVPGSCVAHGGRVGYSVKIVSPNLLNSQMNRLGGPSAAPGAIMNPPKGW